MKKIIEQWDNAAQRYADDQEQSEYVESNKRVVKARFQDLSGRKVLDLGCGYGYYTDYFQSNGADVLGIDGSSKMIEIACTRYPQGSFSLADLSEKLPFADASFDMVFCNQVLMDIEDIELVFLAKVRMKMVSTYILVRMWRCDRNEVIRARFWEDGVYSIQSWIDGDDAEEIMSAQSDTEQYVYGLEVGRILRKIHSIPAPATQEDWESRFNRKMDVKIKKYSECPIKYENGQAFIDYINDNHGAEMIEKSEIDFTQ